MSCGAFCFLGKDFETHSLVIHGFHVMVLLWSSGVPSQGYIYEFYVFFRTYCYSTHGFIKSHVCFNKSKREDLIESAVTKTCEQNDGHRQDRYVLLQAASLFQLVISQFPTSLLKWGVCWLALSPWSLHWHNGWTLVTSLYQKKSRNSLRACFDMYYLKKFSRVTSELIWDILLEISFEVKQKQVFQFYYWNSFEMIFLPLTVSK